VVAARDAGVNGEIRVARGVNFVGPKAPDGKANFTGEMAAEFVSLVNAGTIRLLDILILTKDADGAIDAFEIEHFEGLDELRALETDLAELRR
jgi:hypothetical protein